jgi:radical SAM protein with 4Fe4S-binding SPASM domain
MHKIDRYIYDADRLIFYRDDVGEDAIERIRSGIAAGDNYEALREKLRAYDADEVRIRPGALKRAGICLTNNCNFRCGYCSASSVEGNEETLSLEDVAVFVSDVMKRWAVGRFAWDAGAEPLSLYFTGGGEPTYDWGLFTSSVAHIRERCLENKIPLLLGMTTNGVLDAAQRSFIAEHFDSVMVSYDGTPEVHERNRRCVNRARTSEYIADVIRFFARSRVRISIRTTIWQSDFCRLREMADYILGNLGTAAEWSILPVIPTGRAVNRVRKEHEALREADFVTPYFDVVDYAKDRYGFAGVSTPVFQDIVEAFYCGAISVYCSCPWLMPDRTIITCIESCDIKTVIGKVEGGAAVYFDKCRDPLFKAYQKQFDDCRECVAYRFCKGGCPVRKLMNGNARTTMDDWECAMIREYWIRIFESVISGKECRGWRAVPVEISGLGDAEVLKLAKV